MAATREIALREMEAREAGRLSPVDTRLLAECDARVPTASPTFTGTLTPDPVATLRAARLLRAAAEDSREILVALGRGLSVTPNQRIVLDQVLLNIYHALTAADKAGITRARTVDGSE